MGSNTGKKKTYYAFFDAEYTCYMESDRSFNRKHSGELLSVGVVISDKNFKLQKTYYSPIHPIYNPGLTGYCKQLTGLTQEEIDKAPSYDEVFQELYLLFQEYPVKEIFTWGNDATTLLHDLENNHKSVARKYKRIVGLLRDVTKRLTKRVFGTGITVSLSDMKYICDMEHYTAHNALQDAEDLYRITKCCVQGQYNKERAANLQEYIGYRNIYHQYRRFKKPFHEEKMAGNGKRKKQEFREKSLRYIDAVKKYYQDENGNIPMEIRAFCDDVRSLAGQESVELPKLE